MVELRIDRLSEPHLVRQLAEACILPAIITCRPRWEGGESPLSDDKRLLLLDAACHGKVRYIDVELETARRGSDLPVGRPLICSFHDFEGRPDRLHNVILEMSQRPGSISKIAWKARSIRDCIEAFELVSNKATPTIALCMGEAGMATRILAKKFGAPITFAALDNQAATAPGQLTIEQMKRLYRWDAIDAETRVYGVVASPVSHSLSPAIHNAAFAAAGHDGVYLPLLVEGSYEAFKAFMECFLAMPALHLSGLSITIPHKENALKYLQEKGATIEPLAESIGAVNTIVITNAGQLFGHNTDYAAIVDAITSALGIDSARLAGKSAAIIGAGGTGRTAVAALTHFGVKVTIYNRNLERAQNLAKEFSAAALPLEALAAARCDLYLNTTSLGMSPSIHSSPFDISMPNLGPQNLVFDAVYNPLQTRLLTQASAAGAQTVSGVEMFIRQAARQFELWTGLPAPTRVMRDVVTSHLPAK